MEGGLPITGDKALRKTEAEWLQIRSRHRAAPQFGKLIAECAPCRPSARGSGSRCCAATALRPAWALMISTQTSVITGGCQFEQRLLDLATAFELNPEAGMKFVILIVFWPRLPGVSGRLA